MAEKQEFESIDEIFRKTFKDLPETPAASGWDTPSDRVWQQVQNGIQTRHTGWSASAKLLALVSIAVVTAVGIYLGTRQDSAIIEAPAPVEIAAPASPATVETAPVVVTPAPAASPAALPNTQAQGKAMPSSAQPAVPASKPETEEEAPNHVEAAKINAEQQNSKPKPPNSFERQRQKSPWKTPLPTIPPFRSGDPQGVPVLPDEVKQF